jgi:rRNA maturation endonuclease Nob1
MKTDKYLYEFTVNKESEVEEIESSKNEKGEEVKTIKKVKSNVPVYFRILKPNRKLFDEAELHYGIKLSEGIKAGLLTRSLLAKRYQNDGGAMSESEKQRYATLYIELYKLQNDLQRLEVNLDKLNKEDQTKKITDLLNEINSAKKELQEIENYHSTLFDQTAENRARNQTIMWWVLQLSYISENNKDYQPFFGEGNYDKKIEKYDEIEEKDDIFFREILAKLAYFISLWYMGKANKFEDFKNLETLFSQDELPKEEVKSE